MDVAPFDPTAYYRLSNDVTGSGRTLSLGLHDLPPPMLQMSPTGAYSSENWQFFYDSGIYFIRNYDYGADYQLGVANDRSVPELLSSSGELNMQWNLTHWGDGTWSLRNGYLNSLPLFAVSVNYADGHEIVPAMNLDESQAHWTTDINLSAGRVSNSEMLAAFPSIETAESSSISTAAEASTSTSLSFSAPIRASSATHSTQSSTSTSTTSSSSSLSPTTQPGQSTQSTLSTSSSNTTSTTSQSSTPVTTSVSNSVFKSAIFGAVVGSISVLLAMTVL